MDFRDTKAIYLQIADRICDEVLVGKFAEDSRIPSVREYAAVVEVNANTVMRSFDQLQSQGIIYNKRGIGYFVAAGARERILALRKEQFLTNEVDYFSNSCTRWAFPMPNWRRCTAIIPRIKKRITSYETNNLCNIGCTAGPFGRHERHHYLLGNAQRKCVRHDHPPGRRRADASVACLQGHKIPDGQDFV